MHRMRLVAAILLLIAVVRPAAAQIPGSRAATLARDGWTALDRGQAADAEAAFHEALALESRDPSLFLGAALAAHLQGQSGRARPAAGTGARPQSGVRAGGDAAR